MKKKIIEQNIFQNDYALNRIISMSLIFQYAKSINLALNNNNNVCAIEKYTAGNKIIDLEHLKIVELFSRLP